jgi:hypothetical protein
MKKILLLSFAALLTTFMHAQVTIGVTPYTTLQAAFAAINAGTHTGAITIKITGNTTETASAVLNASGTGSANYTSILIFPTASGLKISGFLNTSLINLNGADNVTIDGRVNATGTVRDLMITNTSTGNFAATIFLIESAQNNVVQYCKLSGATTNVNGGVIYLSTATAGTGNDNNLFDNNSISGVTLADADRPLNAFSSLGVNAARDNSSNTVSNNDIFDFAKTGNVTNGISLGANNSSWTVTGNNIYQTTPVVTTAATPNVTAININNLGTGYTISNNFIGGSAPACGGSAWTTSGAFGQVFQGILVSAGSCSIQGNTISNINWTSTGAGPFSGIRINSGTYDIGSSTGNSIGSSTGTGAIQVTNTTVSSTSNGINITTAGNGSVINNSIGSITLTGTPSTAQNFRGIVKNSIGVMTVTGNTIGSSSTANSIISQTASTSAPGQSVFGIACASTGTLNASSNIIANLSNNYTGTDAAGQVIGIKSTNGINNFNNNSIFNLATSSANAGTDQNASIIGILQASVVAGQTISGTSIHGFSNTNGTAAVHIYGICYQGATTGTNAVSGNLIHSLNLSSSSTSANITGMRIGSGTTTYFNNIITLGTGINTGYTIHGIFCNEASGSSSVYFNTVYIGGNPASGSGTAAFFSNSNSNTRNIRDNIFSNERSGGASHYAAYFNYTSTGTLTLDYNDYRANGTGGVLGFFNGSNVAALPIIAGQDANSIAVNPLFPNAGGTAATDYVPSATLAGITIAGISSDYQLISRAATPTIGALESACTPPAAPTNTTPAANLTICANTSTTLSATGTGTLSWYSAATGGTYLGSGNTFTTASLTTSTSFFVQDSTCAASATRTMITVTVSVITVVPSQTNVTCNGNTDGTATVVASGGTPAYSYSWTSGGTAATETNLAAGNYTCTITDANTCSATQTFTITAPAALSSSDSQTNVSCNGGNNGSATVSVSGGTPAYTYAWAPGGGTAATASGLTAGNYTCTITDANSCTLAETFTITEPAALSGVRTRTNVTCFGGSNGTATVAVSGGTAPYTYSWSPSGGTAATATGLTAGGYTVTVTDANGCTLSLNYTIIQPSAINDTPGQTDVSCNGGNNGTATVTPFGGVGPYTYSWAPSGGTSNTETGLAPGNYTCTITDANGCTFTQSFLITEPAVISDAPMIANISCNGGSDGSITTNISGGTGPFTYAWLPGGETTASISALGTGGYSVTVTDANSCTFTESFTITEPALLASVDSQTDNTCNGGASGSATVVVSGGTSPYSYSWAPSGGTAATASSLAAGNYTCTITDANSCTLSETFTITEPSAITAISSQTDVSCFGGTNGSATVVVSGGTPGYTYSWAPSGGTAATASSLAAGNYTVTITDAASCTSTVTFTITEPATALSASTSQINVSCNGGSDGSATVFASGGVSPYTYSWAPTGGTASTASSLGTGTYTCTITDANTCSTTATVTITEPTAITVSNSQTNVSCFGGNNGSATVSASGGTPGYTYSWAPSGGSSATASGLAAGTYTCTITDANTCSTTSSFTITEPATALSATNSQTNISCNGGNNGTATVVASGGTPAYTYAWSPAGGTAATASGLTAGNYTCTITDANSCTTTATFNITEPAALAVVSSQTNVSCSGNTDGSATVSVSGGTPAYTYAWTPSGGTAATASSLAAGNYTCTITDANACTTTATFSITAPAVLATTSTQTNLSCNGGSNGSATLSVSGGTPAYTYAWAPSGGTAATASGLTAGNYTCTITDANGCTATATVNLTEPSAISVSTSQTNISCNSGSNGSASVFVSGGTPGYTYFWTPSGGTTSTASSLGTGTYTCTITDANSCSTTATVAITEPAIISVTNSQTDVTCAGSNDGTATVSVSGGTPAYTYNWAPSGGFAATASSLSAGTYTCTITDANSCSTTSSFTITAPSAITATSSQTNVSCSGGNNGTATVVASGGTPAYSYAWTPSGGTAATASGLSAGNYTCTITDANGCTLNVTFTLTSPSAITTSSAGQNNVSCFGGNDGHARVFASGGTPSYTYDWTPGNPTGDGTVDVTGLTAGTWTCTVTDANGCTSTQTFSITQPPALSVVSSQTNISCNGGNNGSATVTVSGGTPGYIYSWSPSGGTAATASGLSAGTYTCTITDANACTTTASFTITQPSALTATNSHTNVSCNGGNNGTATVTPSGGTPAYTYAWAPSGGTAATASSLAAGNYTCTITDANGCTTTSSVTITQPAPLTATFVQTNVSCNGGSNGSATVTPSGGTPAYTYAWAPSGGTAATASGLAAGNYTCTVRDANNCSIIVTVTITQPPVIIVTPVSQTNVSCNGGSNGSATVSASGGTPGYTYAWTPSGGTGTTASGLAAGTYTCTVTDANSCTGTRTFNITQPTPITSVNSHTNVSCNGGNNGSATVVVSGGTPAYTYAWAPSGGTAATASGLTAGNYTCTITDANSCTATATFSITQPTPITTVNSHTNVSCNGGNNGSATVVASGGTPAYTYAWAPSGGTAATASGLAAGNYTCTITDANSCTTTATFSITQPTPITSVNSQTNISCNGGNNGSATVVVSGGTPSYTYAWAPSGGTSATASGLTAGNYTCTITDANSCTTTATFSITQPSAITSVNSQTNVSCNGGNNGSATVVVSGGTPSYTYAWAPSGGTAATASGLTAGSYTCTIRDANNCTTTATFNITQPTPIAVTNSQTNVSCNAGNNGSATVSVSGGTPSYTYAWMPSGGTAATASGLTAGSYTCTITDANGCTATATFSITQPTAITFTSSQTNILCNGGNNGSASVVVSGGTPAYTYAWAPSGGTASTASGLTAGNYTCTITDANGCTTTATFNITQPSVILVVSTQTNVSCFGGSNGTATVTVSGGTPAYTYAWAPSGGTGATASGLSTGTYTCTITDANGCTSAATFNITQPAVLSTTSSVMNATCFGSANGQATVIVSGGTPAYSYVWAPSGGTAMTATNLAAGTYTCNVTDANGCTISQSVIITEPAALTASVSQTDVSCFGGTNGTADVIAGGGIPGYNYLWTPGGMVTSSVTGLTAGSYTCTITDANGCTLDQGINITEPNILAATTTVTNVSCAGGSNGTVLVSTTGGTPLYSFNWLPSGGTDSLATGLAPGTYTCDITDANGCSASVTVSISEPPPLNVTQSHTNVTCFGGNNGSATVVVTGGTPAYTYAWSPSGGTGSTASGLTAGTYTCLITDAGGCTFSQTFTIASPASMTATTSQTNVSCNGGSNGSATIIVNGGSPFYSYNWLPSGGTGPIASGLIAGSYTCNVTDANGCTFSQTFLITEPALLTSAISSTSTNCSQSNGTATLVASGGTAPYTYSWSPSGGNAATANGLPAGTYTCTVTDAHGCSTSSSVTVTDIPAPVLSLVSQTNILCHGNNTGDATMSAAGGVGPYTYAWTPTGGNAALASSLLAGTYTCTVTDSAGCTGTQTVAITEPSTLTISITSGMILCNGGSASVNVIAGGGTSPYTGEGIFTDTAGTFVYMVSDTNGCSAIDSITITEPAVLTSSVSSTMVLCNGGSSTITVNANGGTTPYTGTGTFTQPEGTYYFPVTDANGCSTLDSAIITEPAALVVSSSSTSILCNGGTATVTVIASGGTPGYSGDGTFTQMAGTYTYIVTDTNGCFDSTSITIGEPAILTAVIDSVFNPTGCSAADGMIYITANGGTTAYNYLWTNSSIIEDQSGLSAGSYSCTITDANGCTTMVDTSLVDPAPPVVTVSIDTVLCVSNAPYVLTEGNPSGGIWSGTSISGNSFDPAIGVGSYVLTYTYTAPNGCTGSGSDTMTVDACIGISENPSAATWSAYPNPTYGNITLISNGNDNKDHLVEVYAADGKLVRSEMHAAGEPVEVNMTTFAEGIYMIRITTGTAVSTVRVIKQ